MIRSRSNPQPTDQAPVLAGRRIRLRPLTADDFLSWQEVRRRNAEWLTRWEPRRAVGSPDPISNREAFQVRCRARDRERQTGAAFGFGVFSGHRLLGEINVSGVQRGAFQTCHVGYWIDERFAGQGYTPEAMVILLRFAFEELELHRVQISVIPRNTASRRIPEKLGIRSEGTAERYLEINGVWEDHVRYAITAEEWQVRSAELIGDWL